MIDWRKGKRVTIAPGVVPGPFVVIGDDATIGENVRLAAGVYIAPAITIGRNVDIGPHAVVLADVPPHTAIAPNEVWREALKEETPMSEPEPPWDETRGPIVRRSKGRRA